MVMVNKSTKKETTKAAKQKFLKEVKEEKYAKIEKTSIRYSRVGGVAQPYANSTKSIVFYSVR